jgi:predicted nucleic acid-binding protein
VARRPRCPPGQVAPPRVRVLVDTSAWVEFLNGSASPEREAVARLLGGEDDVCTCGVIVAEVLQGLRRDQERRRIEEFFGQMTFLEAQGIGLFVRAAALYRSLRKRGTTVRSTIDCLIAVLAEENGCAILARDRDLSAILSSGLVASRAWR